MAPFLYHGGIYIYISHFLICHHFIIYVPYVPIYVYVYIYVYVHTHIYIYICMYIYIYVCTYIIRYIILYIIIYIPPFGFWSVGKSVTTKSRRPPANGSDCPGELEQVRGTPHGFQWSNRFNKKIFIDFNILSNQRVNGVRWLLRTYFLPTNL